MKYSTYLIRWKRVNGQFRNIMYIIERLNKHFLKLRYVSEYMCENTYWK